MPLAAVLWGAATPGNAITQNSPIAVVAPGNTDGNGEVDSDDLFNILEVGKFNQGPLGLMGLLVFARRSCRSGG